MGYIDNNVFQRVLHLCRPPGGWPKRLAIANSGGPDSTCLLFLLRRLVSLSYPSPFDLVSLSVDHGFQPTSAVVAQRAAEYAASLDIEHHVLPIQWGTSPLPPCPQQGDAFERIARNARYHTLLDGMRRTGCRAIAFGHHADDQLETVLMRMSKGSSFHGMVGMQPVRRWGMGFGQQCGDLAWAGADGLDRWIIRPLLDFSKSRLLKTCHMHGISYAIDTTNFQPNLTERNYIRQILSNADKPLDLVNAPLRDAMLTLEERGRQPNSLGYTRLDHLRSGLVLTRAYAQQVEEEASTRIVQCMIPSRPGTVLMDFDVLKQIQDSAVQRAIIIRVLRYTSPSPWGSLMAEARRKAKRLNAIIDAVWNRHEPVPITAGSSVLWSPVAVTSDDVVKHRAGKPHERRAWLVTRQPPIAKKASHGIYPLQMEISNVLFPKLGLLDTPHVTLWDNRFIVRILPGVVPQALAWPAASRSEKLIVIGEGKGFWPALLWQRRKEPDTIIARYRDKEDGRNPRNTALPHQYHSLQIEFEWIRPHLLLPL